MRGCQFRIAFHSQVLLISSETPICWHFLFLGGGGDALIRQILSLPVRVVPYSSHVSYLVGVTKKKKEKEPAASARNQWGHQVVASTAIFYPWQRLRQLNMRLNSPPTK